MFDEFICALTEELRKRNISEQDIRHIVYNYTKAYNALIDEGNSVENAVNSFGEPSEIAENELKNTLCKMNKPATNLNKAEVKKMSSVYLNDALFLTPGLIIGSVGTLVLAFMTCLIGIVSAYYCYKVWTDAIFTTTGAKVLAFIMALLGLLVCALGCYLTYVLIYKMCKGTKRYLDERKSIVEFIKKNGNNDNKTYKS